MENIILNSLNKTNIVSPNYHHIIFATLIYFTFPLPKYFALRSKNSLCLHNICVWQAGGGGLG